MIVDDIRPVMPPELSTSDDFRIVVNFDSPVTASGCFVDRWIGHPVLHAIVDVNLLVHIVVTYSS